MIMSPILCGGEQIQWK